MAGSTDPPWRLPCGDRPTHWWRRRRSTRSHGRETSGLPAQSSSGGGTWAPTWTTRSPRGPFYPADGRKLLAIYSWPTELGVELERDLGPFPFFNFWGPKAGLPSTRWIADATIQTLKGKKPDLTLAYLPHLDYDHQRYGPGDPRSLQALREVDGIVGELVDAADAQGTQVMVVSEYGITDVSRAIHPNLALRDAGLLVARETPTGDVLDVFGSRAFAVADHQLAHVYVKDERARDEAARVLEALPGVDLVLGEEGKRAHGISHANAGDLVLVSDTGNSRIFALSKDGAVVDWLDTGLAMNALAGIEVGPDGALWVVDRANARVLRYAAP